MLHNSPKRLCDFKTFSGGYTPGPPLKTAGKGKEGSGGEGSEGEESGGRNGGEGRQGEGRWGG
jgi:hypothetical protein